MNKLRREQNKQTLELVGELVCGSVECDKSLFIVDITAITLGRGGGDPLVKLAESINKFMNMVFKILTLASKSFCETFLMAMRAMWI